MTARVAMLALACLFVACKKKEVAPRPDAAAPVPGVSVARPATAPCAADTDCAVYLDPCNCSCYPMLVSAPAVSGEAWGRACGGLPPRNCGAASPCMNRNPTCDPTTKTCVVAATKR